jgi:hypothetical protein
VSTHRKSVVILQPQYLPWAGLFDQIKLSDVFVHFDDVALPQGRSFSNRVQLKTERGQTWLTVPLVRKSRGLIKDVLIDESSGWREEHRQAIQRSLRKAPHFDALAPLVDRIFAFESSLLSAFNANAIELVSAHLGIGKTFARSSERPVDAHSSEKLLGIVRQFEGDRYVTGHGARNYLDHELFEKAGVDVGYIRYDIVPYAQPHGDFTPYVSILDMLAHCGPETLGHMQSQIVAWRDFVSTGPESKEDDHGA